MAASAGSSAGRAEVQVAAESPAFKLTPTVAVVLAPLAPFLPGMAHAMATAAVGSPFDTVKTRVQVGMFDSPWKAAYATVRQEGMLALYRGASMPLVAAMAKRPFEFAAFEWCNERFGRKGKGPFIGGAVAGVIASCLGCPFGVVKVQMQSNVKETYRSPLNVMGDILRSRGVLGFYRGFGPSLIMSVPSCTFYLGAYGALREALPPSQWTPALAGMLASFSMWSCLLPLDNVRTNIQAQSFRSDQAVPSFAAKFVDLVKGPRGLRGLWAGWTAVAARGPIVSACSMLAYEKAREFASTLTASSR